MAGPLTEGVKTGLGIAQFLENRNQFKQNRQLNQQKIGLQNRQQDLAEQQAQEDAFQEEFNRDAGIIKDGTFSGLKGEAQIKALTPVYSRLFKKVGGPLGTISDKQVAASIRNDPSIPSQIEALVKSCAKSQDAQANEEGKLDCLANTAEGVALLFPQAKTSGEIKGIETAISQIEGQQEQLQVQSGFQEIENQLLQVASGVNDNNIPFSPEMQQAAVALRRNPSFVEAVNSGTPEGLEAARGMMSKAFPVGGATEVDARFKKIDPAAYTQASVVKFEKSGKFSDLVPRIKTTKDVGNLLAGKDKFRATLALSKQFAAQSKPFRAVRDSFARIQESAKNPSAAGDLSMIFNYMKMLDPGSVVRESEFATAAASGSFGDRFVAIGKRLETGERLADPMRADFLDRAVRLMSRQTKQHDQRVNFFGKQAERFGLDPEAVVIPLEDPELNEDAFNTAFEELMSVPGAREDQVFEELRRRGFQ